MVSHTEMDYITISRHHILVFHLCSSHAFLTLTYQVPMDFLNISIILDLTLIDSSLELVLTWVERVMKVTAGKIITGTELLELCILKIAKDKKTLGIKKNPTWTTKKSFCLVWLVGWICHGLDPYRSWTVPFTQCRDHLKVVFGHLVVKLRHCSSSLWRWFPFFQEQLNKTW